MGSLDRTAIAGDENVVPLPAIVLTFHGLPGVAKAYIKLLFGPCQTISASPVGSVERTAIAGAENVVPGPSIVLALHGLLGIAK